MPGLKKNTKYEADNGQIHRIKIDDERFTHVGTPPSGTLDSKISVKLSKHRGGYGLKPRGVVLSRVLGTAPNTFKKFSFLPVLTVTAFATSAFDVGATITIGSTAWTVESKQDEQGT